MKIERPRIQGFALVLTLSLLALLVLAIWALGGLVRVGSRAATSSNSQMQARQNALLSLSVALGELQRTAGPDDRVTGMAGVMGITANSANATRHWCGVWTSGGVFLGWLTSGAQSNTPALSAGVQTIDLVANGSVGAPQANSEPVRAGKLPVQFGAIAYWVGDEGVKITVAPVLDLVPPGSQALRLTNLAAKSAADVLRAYATQYPSVASKAMSYEQLIRLSDESPPSGYETTANRLTSADIADNFHHATLNAVFQVSAGTGVTARSGMLNINTNSQIVWRSVVDSYNDANPSLQISKVGTGSTATSNIIASGFSSGPYLSLTAFEASAVATTAFATSGVTPAQFVARLGTMLAVRSDTFRIRAYGEVTDPSDGSILSSAYCEAIVQRDAASAGGAFGRRFKIVLFRWLAPPNTTTPTDSDV